MFILKHGALSTVHQGLRSNLTPLCHGIEDLLIGSFRRLSTTCVLKEGEADGKLIQYGIKEEKSSKAMRAYLERSQAYNQFMDRENEEYKTGKRHLANMMGKNPESFTQSDVDEAIEYLFPSGIYIKKARPLLKPPEEVHPPKKEAEFDETGRPYHYLFYTGKPSFYGFLHKLVDTIKELNNFEDTMIRKQLKPDPALALTLEGYQWLTKEEFENKFIEELTAEEYRQLIATLERIVTHPYSYRAKDIITESRATYKILSDVEAIPKPELQADGKEFVTFKESRRKTAIADVTVRSPGSGQFNINGFDLVYFEDLHIRDQLLFPLHMTGKVGQVDVESTVRGGGPSAQGGAIRYGLSMALRSFVDLEMVEQMRLAGLLTRDKRRRERKKPGQAKARRKFTWKKR